MSRRLTYSKDGEWGLTGISREELIQTNEKIYGALCKLKDYEETELDPRDIDMVKLMHDDLVETVDEKENIIERMKTLNRELLLHMGYGTEQVKDILHADVIERDDNGDIIAWGSDKQYHTHYTEIMNGEGYYDVNGHYVRNKYNVDD